ncbi:MAG TPA: methyltransferase domain-containing protein [Gammaproteobacteria bacterium]|nr:methyltransferase domain-containing protein [Gammaproteobacteria bacterium]
MDVKSSVLERYSEGAKAQQADLCCPVDYNTDLLKILPNEILERDYGCGDPSRYVREGDTVLDLGSGGGKICYIAAQLVGDSGHVIGLDMNHDMLELAQKYQAEMADKIGADRVTFHYGHIQDLALDLNAADSYLQEHPIRNKDDLEKFDAWQQQQKHTQPLIADNSIDLVVSNCVLNLVDDAQKMQLIHEIFRVLKPGGRVAISDIISDTFVPDEMKADPELWSGCISGVFQEKEFIKKFLDAGFYAVAYDKWDSAPWKIINDIEFRSVTLTAIKTEQTVALDEGHTVIYKGPFTSVTDDMGYVFDRGDRIAVSNVHFKALQKSSLAKDFVLIEPLAKPCCAENWSDSMFTLRSVTDSRTGLASTENTSSCCG